MGDLHNEALAATYQPIRGGRDLPLEVSRMVERLRAWGPKAGPLSGYLASRPGPDAAAKMIVTHLREAGITNKSGRVLPGAFNDTGRMTDYLERKRLVGRELAAVLRQAGRERIGARELARRIELRSWHGPDIVRSQVLVNMLRASDSYWSGQSQAQEGQVPPGPGFWDAVGGILTFELGPGSIVGGYLMSCASAGSWL